MYMPGRSRTASRDENFTGFSLIEGNPPYKCVQVAIQVAYCQTPLFAGVAAARYPLVVKTHQRNVSGTVCAVLRGICGRCPDFPIPLANVSRWDHGRIV